MGQTVARLEEKATRVDHRLRKGGGCAAGILRSRGTGMWSHCDYRVDTGSLYSYGIRSFLSCQGSSVHLADISDVYISIVSDLFRMDPLTLELR